VSAPVTGVCFKCRERPGTSWWTEGAMAYVHGATAPVCDLCALRMQLEHAVELAAVIPELRRAIRIRERADRKASKVKP
jgi:hypothetical protein